MNIVVFVGGIADPKRPLPRLLDRDTLLAARPAETILSPFDEAAIEVALKVRDVQPEARITALVACVGPADPLLRTLGGLRVDRTYGICTSGFPNWDGVAYASTLAEAARSTCPDAALYLIGREFGDFDDGTVPAALAERLGSRYSSLATAAAVRADGVRLVRQRGGRIERVAFAGPVLASVTNDAGNRLRHPLMKNIVAARKAVYEVLVSTVPDEAAVALVSASLAIPESRSAPCRMLGGDVDRQARDLAALLVEAT